MLPYAVFYISQCAWLDCLDQLLAKDCSTSSSLLVSHYTKIIIRTGLYPPFSLRGCDGLGEARSKLALINSSPS